MLCKEISKAASLIYCHERIDKYKYSMSKKSLFYVMCWIITYLVRLVFWADWTEYSIFLFLKIILLFFRLLTWCNRDVLWPWIHKRCWATKVSKMIYLMFPNYVATVFRIVFKHAFKIAASRQVLTRTKSEIVQHLIHSFSFNSLTRITP